MPWCSTRFPGMGATLTVPVMESLLDSSGTVSVAPCLFLRVMVGGGASVALVKLSCTVQALPRPRLPKSLFWNGEKEAVFGEVT